MGIKVQSKPTKAEETPAVSTAPVASATEVKEKTAAAVTAESVVTEVNSEILGSLSDKVAFVKCIGDPSEDDKTTIEDKKTGKKVSKVDPMIVGYIFKTDVDLQVPDCQPGEDFRTKGNLMSYSGDPFKTRLVKAGSYFALTKFETGMLLSRDEFNTKISGGDKPCTCVYTKTSKKTSAGQLGKINESTDIPTVSLRAIVGSVKDIAMQPVLTFTKETRENGTIRKHRTLITDPIVINGVKTDIEFSKWANLCKENVRVAGPRTSSAPATAKRNEAAASFLAIVGKKKAAVK